PEGDEACADRDHASLTAPTGFLKHHHGGERPHPPEVGDTCGEPDEHQRPAAPEAEEPMSLAEPERSLDAASVVLEEERAGMAALAQTSLLQARELEPPGQHEHGPGDDLGTRLEPCPSVHDPMEPQISEEGDHTEGGPHGGIPEEEARHRASRAGLI